MRNQLAYEAYMGFLLKSMFIVGIIALIACLSIFLIDLLFVLFSPRYKAKVIRADIIAMGKQTSFGQYYGIFISYIFEYDGYSYNCHKLNATDKIVTNGYRKAESILQENINDNNEITVYVCPFNPNLSIVLPFQEPMILKVGLFVVSFIVFFTARLLKYI